MLLPVFLSDILCLKPGGVGNPSARFKVQSLANPTLVCVLECDNCAQTLLNDLEKLDDELRRIKTQLDNASASATSQDSLKKLEKAVADTKVTRRCTVTQKATERAEYF